MPECLLSPDEVAMEVSPRAVAATPSIRFAHRRTGEEIYTFLTLQHMAMGKPPIQTCALSLHLGYFDTRAS
jgi:hypothetical protein